MKSQGIKSIKWVSVFILVVTLSFSVSCTSKKKVIDDDFAVDSAEAGFSEEDLVLDGEPDESVDIAEGTDDFNELDLELDGTEDGEETALSIEDELNNISDESMESEIAEAEVSPDVAPEAEVENIPAPEIVEVDPPVETPPLVEAPITEEPVLADVTPVEEAPAVVLSRVNNIQYKGNDSGGTVIISSDQPLNYTTRINSTTNQVIVEVQDVVVADRLKRPLNTKDMSSSIGHVDVYQKSDSNIARFVVQLRPNSPEPLVQPEGNSLLIIGSAIDGSGPSPSRNDMIADGASEDSGFASDTMAQSTSASGEGLMSSDDLEAFLASNNKFYGKPISIETTDMDIRDILKLISEESGVNMVFDDDVSGRSTLKLRKVPWDQALITLLRSKKLGFRRQGSVLRIAKIDTLVKEDTDAVKLKESKATVEPLIVRNFMINYAEVDKLESKIKDFIAESKAGAATRGRVTTDSRTNTLIITETATKLDQIAQLIRALDTQPQQVMIEARIVEASDTYARTIGGNIGLNRQPFHSPGVLAPGTTSPTFLPNRITTPQGPNYVSPSLNITPTEAQSGSFLGQIFFGTLGAFGNLDAQLALDESEGRVKILSSPRVAVLTNTTATINQGATILSRASTTTGAVTTGASTDTFTSVKVGVTLKVTPQVSNIGTVRLKLDVSRTAPTPTGQPGETTDRNVVTEIIVKSGDTSVVGGVFQSDVSHNINGVPGLKDIPILGTLFKGDKRASQKTELMIFVTPKVIPLLNQMFKADSGAESSQDPF